VFHSDRGVQHGSGVFLELVRLHGFLQSMSRKGEEARQAVFEYVYRYYRLIPHEGRKFLGLLIIGIFHSP